jgi:hypothetical protein
MAFFSMCFLLPRLLLMPTIFAMNELGKELGYAASWLAFFLFPLGISFQLSKAIGKDLSGRVELIDTTWGVLLLVVIPGLVTALLGGITLFTGSTTLSALFRIAATAITLLILSGVAALVWAHEKSGPWLSALAGANCIGSLVSTILAPRTANTEQTLVSKLREVALDAALVVVVAGVLVGVGGGVGYVVEKAANLGNE